MKKLTKKLMLSILTVALTFIALGTSTFAWFSINDTVNVTGMKVHTQVSDNLFITSDTIDSTAAITDDSLYKNALVSSTYSLIEPVSTVNGKNFFYTATNNVESTGDAKADTYVAYTPANTAAFNENYKTTGAVGYVDYVFQLKAINMSDSASAVVLTQLDLTYGGTANASKAFRVALFVEALTTVNNKTNATNTVASAGNLDAINALIYTPGSAANFTSGQAVTSTSALGAVTYVTSASSSSWAVAANTTAYFKMVVRLWLEGEDNTCNNTTFASLTDDWALDLKFKLTTDAPTIVNINQPVTAAKIDLKNQTAAATKETSVAGLDLYLLATVSDTKYYVTTASQTSAAATAVYVLVDGRPVDVTNQCELK